jgi:hypothetical protein
MAGNSNSGNYGPMPQETRERISRTMRAKSWLSLFTPIRQAADAGNEREAVRLLRAYIRDRKEEAA